MRTRIAGGSVFRTGSVLNGVNPHNKGAKLTALLDTGQKKIKQRNEKKKPTKKKSKERKKRRLTI